MTENTTLSKLQSLDLTLLQSHLFEIDQESARFLLSLNFTSNRTLSTARVDSYRKTMKQGDWKLSAPLLISASGKLIDGQHRLSAIPEGCSIPFLIQTGMPDNSAEVLDQGKVRNALDITKIRGVKGIWSSHISILRMMFAFRGNRLRLTPSKIADIFEKRADIVDAVNFSMQYRKRSTAIQPSSVLAVIARAKLSDAPLSDLDLDYFLYCFQTGGSAGYHSTPPVRSSSVPCSFRLTVEKWMRDKGSGSGGRARKELFTKTQAALDAYKDNREISTFREISRNLFPVPSIDQMDFKTLEQDPSIKPSSECGI